VIVLATKESQSNEDHGAGGHTSNPIIIASVELRLQPCDAKIPFTLPWIDRIERKLFSSYGMKQKQPQNDDLQPYLSNLCVDEMYRGRGIGKLLVHCVETIAKRYWGYHQMYLHVDLENVPAVQLYKKQGYTDVGRRWNPFWAGKAADIGYFVKNIQ
jgi:GNAT superfamily N-acetyltransferase